MNGTTRQIDTIKNSTILTFFEACIAIILLTLLFIPFLIIALVVKLTDRGPIIHWSKRIGKNNIIFMMPKFRTMQVNTPQLATHLMSSRKSYVTPFGKFLRKTSLDELPQLISIIKGDMSFVGPRPALFNQYDLIELRTKNNIHLLKPGITGWAQINGRDQVSISEKVQLEIEYLDKLSLFFDFKIICLTFSSVLSKKNISH